MGSPKIFLSLSLSIFSLFLSIYLFKACFGTMSGMEGERSTTVPSGGCGWLNSNSICVTNADDEYKHRVRVNSEAKASFRIARCHGINKTPMPMWVCSGCGRHNLRYHAKCAGCDAPQGEEPKTTMFRFNDLLDGPSQGRRRELFQSTSRSRGGQHRKNMGDDALWWNDGIRNASKWN